MNHAVDNLLKAQKFALNSRPKVGGFPYLAEVMRQAGVTENTWTLPTCQSLYLTKLGPVVTPGMPLISSIEAVPPFNQEDLVKAIRVDQAGESTFPEFLQAAWMAGVIRYTVQFEQRVVTYYGAHGETYVESYPAVAVTIP